MRTKDPAKAEQIRASALEMLARDGFDGFSMQKLAKAAKVSPATLYIHFQDRDDLLFQLYKEQTEIFSSALLEGFDPESPFREGLEVQWRNRVRFCREHPLGWCFLDQVLYSPYQKEFSTRIESPFKRVLRHFMRNAITRGEIIDFGTKAGEKFFPLELFWSLAYAPLYELLQFERGNGGPGAHRRKKPFHLEPELFDLAFQRVLRSLQP